MGRREEGEKEGKKRSEVVMMGLKKKLLWGTQD